MRKTLITLMLLAQPAAAVEMPEPRHFEVSFTALDPGGVVEHVVIPVEADNEPQCNYAATFAVFGWLSHHDKWSQPRAIRCAAPGEAYP